FGNVKDAVVERLTNVKDSIKDGLNSALDFVLGLGGKFVDAGKKIVTSIADGIKGAIGKVTDAVKNVAQKIRDFLPFSPPKTGPLIDIMDVKWGETIGAGMEKGEDEVSKAMDEMLAFDLTKKATFSNANANNPSDNEMIALLMLLIEAVKEGKVLQVDGKTFAQIMGDYTSAEVGNRIRKIKRGLA